MLAVGALKRIPDPTPSRRMQQLRAPGKEYQYLNNQERAAVVPPADMMCRLECVQRSIFIIFYIYFNFDFDNFTEYLQNHVINRETLVTTDLHICSYHKACQVASKSKTSDIFTFMVWSL
jgi:hypothetical protein